MEYDNERRPLEYKLLSLTYKVLTTSQPSYLNNLISVQPPRSTRSSSVVTLSRQPTISLKITDRSFRYVSGINSLIHSVSLASHVSTHLLLSAHLYYFHHVAQSDDLRFLGVQLSSDLSLDKHVNVVSASASFIRRSLDGEASRKFFEHPLLRGSGVYKLI